jgi:uncharacterized membrane protein
MIEIPAAIAAARASAPRWLWIALIASLAMNCLVLGIVFRSVWQIEGVQALGGDRVSAGLGGYVASLPPERRKVLRRIGSADRPLLRPLRLELRKLRDEVTQILETEPLDKERLAAAQARILETEVEMRKVMQRSLAELAARMTPEERRAFLRWQETHRPAALLRRRNATDEELGGAGPSPKQPR